MMDIRIYQINLDRDEDGVAFESLDMLEKYQPTNEIKAELYDKTFEGEVEAVDLEDIYRIFNIEKPEGFDGRSLSVSDVVEVVKSDEVKLGCYYCDNIGFKSVPFETEKSTTPVKQSIMVVMCEPGKLAKTAEIGTRLEDLQKAVGGCIEAYYPFEEEVCIVCNDEGKFNGMSPCREKTNSLWILFSGRSSSVIVPEKTSVLSARNRLRNTRIGSGTRNTTSDKTAKSSSYLMNRDSPVLKDKPKENDATGLRHFTSKHRLLGTKVCLLG